MRTEWLQEHGIVPIAEKRLSEGKMKFDEGEREERTKRGLIATQTNIETI